jgi:hypothetical protein
MRLGHHSEKKWIDQTTAAGTSDNGTERPPEDGGDDDPEPFDPGEFFPIE